MSALFFRIARATGLLAVLALVSCTVDLLPGDQPAPQLFVLTPKNTFAPDLPRVDWQLSVDVPIAEAGLNTSRIAVQPTPYTLEYFERAAWIDTAPRMVQTLLVESFENTQRIVAVAREAVSLRADYSLITELREFQAEYPDGGKPRVRVRLIAKLVRMPQRNIIASTATEHVVEAAGPSLEEIVPAFDEALGKILKRIVEWTLRNAPAKG